MAQKSWVHLLHTLGQRLIPHDCKTSKQCQVYLDNIQNQWT